MTNFMKNFTQNQTIAVIGILTLIGSAALLGITIWAWKITSVTSYDRNLATFEALTADNRHAMRSRLDSYRQSLDSGAALFAASELVPLSKWEAFVNVLNIEETLPGINGIGFIVPVLQEDIAAYLESAKANGVKNLEVHPRTDRLEIMSITYIEPLEPNKEAVGLDIAFEDHRREAANYSRNTGRATITKHIDLVQDKTKSAGFLLLRPMYEGGKPLETAIQRRAAFKGWIYAPFIAARFMKDLTTSQGKSFELQVYDGTAPLQSDLIFTSNKNQKIADRKSEYQISRTFPMMEQNWTVVWKSTPEFEASVRTQEPILILIGGLALTAAFVVMMVFYARRETYVRNEVAIKTEALVTKEQEVRGALAKAQRATEAKSKFLANMSHEIRTPMNGVIGFTQLLDDGNLCEKQQRYVQMILDSGAAMMNLLNDILDISKVDAGLLAINEEPVDVPNILKICMKLISPTAETKGLESILDVDPKIPSSIKTDGLRLRQVVLNLLANAVKFTEVGHVKLAVKYHPAKILAGGFDQPAEMAITVSDTGIGIDPERQKVIFEPFLQADDSTARKYGGTGLGLTISSQLVELMQGRISLTSKLNGGSKFTVILPAKTYEDPMSNDTNDSIDSRARRQEFSTRRLNILVAEDHDVNQLLLREMLAKLDCDLMLASDGAEAVAEARAAETQKRPFDLVLMDIQMPNMDGLKATKAIRRHGITAAQLPIIALTANAYAQDVENCFEAGMQAHLAKPFSITELKDILEIWGTDYQEAEAA
ncbi:CHASE domain-containing protein [Parasphingorhabdus cellanae]|uniref:histidine kinase n=1 Tax=Parasphingorhabdus cellanae TaxID=2806553 RepID=A0ABX7T7M8_9SPHN|nr:CHASE domain-containing protein [Parasphingorhabdus cellanae]QTD56220.1 CHASE domain-containing protein [Parasphingorhabdus cellanae]